jgi:S-adenosylmethionine:tRNA ribosyltransferase-isomerase
MRLSDFHFDLPDAHIAQRPLPERGASRLLDLDGPTWEVRDLEFADLPRLLNPGDLLVFNDTRVIRARLFAHKESGGRVEIPIERLVDGSEAPAHLPASKAPKPGDGWESTSTGKSGWTFARERAICIACAASISGSAS